MLFEERDPEHAERGQHRLLPGRRLPLHEVVRGSGGVARSRVILEFEGVYRHSQVFVNGHLVGGRPSGYAVFYARLDEHLLYGAENRRRGRRGQLRDSPTAAGTRAAASTARSPARRTADPHRPSGRQGHHQGRRSQTTATLAVTATVVNDGTDARRVTVRTEITGPDGITLAPTRHRRRAPTRRRTTTVRQEIQVPDAQLWSPETPQLYCARVTLLDGDERHRHRRRRVRHPYRHGRRAPRACASTARRSSSAARRSTTTTA